MYRTFRIASFIALATMGLTVFLACSGGAAPTPAMPQPTMASPGSGTTPAQELRPIVASTDVSPGPNRLVFAVLDRDSNPIREAEAKVSLFYLIGNQAELKGTTQATFRRWPMGPGGVYVTYVTLDKAGTWGIEVSIADAGGAARLGRASFAVKERSSTPAIGSPAPKSQSRTSRDVSALEQITSDPQPDLDLYSLTVAEAIATGKPTLITFATPAFCTSATCGPQVDVVKELKNKYKGRANFIHIEIYDNPLEMRGDLRKGHVAVAVNEWSLPSEPWTFLIDGKGRVSAKFEGFTNAEDLEGALLQLLQ